MSRINLGEMNELALSVQSVRFKEDNVEETERKRDEKPVKSNETAKREMASELLLQGFTEKAICRILNISPDQMPEQLPF
jgi:hypothetical protein